jgi:hypothetical protein
MQIIDVPYPVSLIPNGMFPKTPLPNIAFTVDMAWRNRSTLVGSAKIGWRWKVTRVRKIEPPGVKMRR